MVHYNEYDLNPVDDGFFLVFMALKNSAYLSLKSYLAIHSEKLISLRYNRGNLFKVIILNGFL